MLLPMLKRLLRLRDRPDPTAWLLLLLAVAWSPSAVAANLHPQDGPHADVRIRVEDDAVVFTVSLNLVFLDELIDSGREDEAVIHPVEAAGVEAGLLRYFAEANEVEIDGVVVLPIARAFELIEPDIDLLPLFPVSGERGLRKVRLDLVYPAKSVPQRVRMVWGPYPEDILLSTPDDPLKLEIAAELTASGTMTIVNFRESEPEHTWHRAAAEADRFLPVPAPPTATMLPLPTVSLGLAGAAALLLLLSVWRPMRPLAVAVVPVSLVLAVMTLDMKRVEIENPFAPASRLPTTDEARATFEPLHANIYRAFDYTGESDIYDALAQSVDGDLLQTLYDQIYRSLIMYEEGGALSRVETVEPMQTEIESIGLLEGGDRVGFQVLARWRVTGIVVHWGHSHTRTNEYLAAYTVGSTDAGWRIMGNEVREQMRVEIAGEPPEDEQPLDLPEDVIF
ncbi:MAG: hypothetical protein ACYTF9_00530 [Planctomycetota bacterium]|jgi:hypothetical protein